METQRLPEETNLQWLAYCCYRDLGEQRSIVAAFQKYCEQRSKAKPSKENIRTDRPNGSFVRWKKEFEWEKRARLWDLDIESRKREAVKQAEDVAYQEELEDFRRSQLAAGKAGFKIALVLKKEVLDFMEKNPKIKTLKEAFMASRIIASLEISSSEQWAKALHIELLLDRMNEEDSYQEDS
jgi:hypothetical protein